MDFEKLFMMERFETGYKRAVLCLMEENPQAMFLDLGCLTGEFTIEMASKIGTKKVFGIEILDEMMKEAVARGIKVSKGDLNEPFPFSDDSFDVICGSQIIEHLCDTDGFLKEIHRVLKQDGYVVLSTPNLASFNIIAYLLAGKQPPVACVSDENWPDAVEGQHLHRRLFTLPGLKRALEFHGLKVEKVAGSCYYPLPAALSRVMCLIDKRHPACITVKARKQGL